MGNLVIDSMGDEEEKFFVYSVDQFQLEYLLKINWGIIN